MELPSPDFTGQEEFFDLDLNTLDDTTATSQVANQLFADQMNNLRKYPSFTVVFFK